MPKKGNNDTPVIGIIGFGMVGKAVQFGFSDVANFRIYDNSTGNSSLGKYISGGAPDNEWIHFAVTYDGSSSESGIKIYKNGLLATTSSASSGSSYTAMENLAANLQIGLETDDVIYMDGKIRELKIFNTELSADDIANETANGSLTDNLVAYYKLDGDVNDSSENELDGVNYNVTFSMRSLLSLESDLE